MIFEFILYSQKIEWIIHSIYGVKKLHRLSSEFHSILTPGDCKFTSQLVECRWVYSIFTLKEVTTDVNTQGVKTELKFTFREYFKRSDLTFTCLIPLIDLISPIISSPWNRTMESGKSTPINAAHSDAKRGDSESQPLLSNSAEKKTYDAIQDATSDNVIKTGPDGDFSYDKEFKAQLKRAESRYLTVEIPVALTGLVFQMLTTLETEYINERLSDDYNYTRNSSVCANYSDSESIGAKIQSETSMWMFYLGLAYALPSRSRSYPLKYFRD